MGRKGKCIGVRGPCPPADTPFWGRRVATAPTKTARGPSGPRAGKEAAEGGSNPIRSAGFHGERAYFPGRRSEDVSSSFAAGACRCESAVSVGLGPDGD